MYYIDDQTTALVCREDLVGEYFYDIELQSTFADKFTFNTSENYQGLNKPKIPFTYESGSDLYRSIYPLDFCFDYVQSGYRPIAYGFLIVTAVQQQAVFEQFHTKYPINTYLLPFAFDGARNLDPTAHFYYLNDETELATLNDFQTLSEYTLNGFKIISTHILPTAAHLVIAESIAEDLAVNARLVFTQLSSQATLGIQKFNNLNVLRVLSSTFVQSINYNRLYDLGNGNEGADTIWFGDDYQPDSPVNTNFNSLLYDNPYFQKPFYKIKIAAAGYEEDVDPLIIKNTVSNPTTKVPYAIVQSLLPPYVSLFVFNLIGDQWIGGSQRPDAISEGMTRYVFFPNRALNSQQSFMDFKDNFKEFLRTNYNSTIQGLVVAQQAERSNFEIKRQLAYTKSEINAYSGNAEALFSLNPTKIGASGVRGLSSLLTTDIEQNAAEQILNNNQAKEKQLLKLKLADIYNTPNSISIVNDVQMVLYSQTYSRISILKNAAYDSMILDINMYGITIQQPINGIPKVHSRYDYIRTNSLIVDYSKLPFSSVERVKLEEIYSKGVRYWYAVDEFFKDFDYPN